MTKDPENIFPVGTVSCKLISSKIITILYVNVYNILKLYIGGQKKIIMEMTGDS